MSMRKLTTAVLALVLLAAISMVGYARFVFSPREFAQELQSSLIEQVLQGQTGQLTRLSEKLADQTHQGPKPCLRYSQQAPSEEELSVVVEELFALGLGEDFILWVSQFGAWAEEHEEQFHRHSREEEVLDAIGESLGLFDRIMVILARDRVLEALTQLRSEATADLTKRHQKKFSLQSPDRQKAIKDLWNRNKTTLTFPGFVRISDRLKVKTTEARLDKLARSLLQWASAKNSFPKDLEELGTPEEWLKDGWHLNYDYQRTPTGARLSSLGADGIRGGQDLDADIVRNIETSREQ